MGAYKRRRLRIIGVNWYVVVWNMGVKKQRNSKQKERETAKGKE